MTEEPQQPEGETPEDRAPEGVPGEPGEATPSETPAPDETPAETPAEAPTETPDETPADPEAPGPEIEGLEELDQAATAEPAAAGEPPAEAEEPPAAAEELPAAAEEPPAAADAPAAERPRGRPPADDAGAKDDVIPGAHLEPDLVLDEQRSEEGEYGEYGEYADADAAAAAEGEPGEDAEPAPVAYTPLELAADARYSATGKRKSAIARVILKPGEGTYTVNGRHLDEYFPRVRLQRMASQPLEAAGYQTRMDVVARIHGGGVSAQANALRHGIARALVEADPALRTELKRRGYLTRDPREKERKKAGLKKARKRPQFSKR
jgi:small subunit ribosomal protein S9